MRHHRRLAAALVGAALVLSACSSGSDTAVTGSPTCPDGDAPTAPAGPDALPVATLGVLGADESVSTACLVGTPLVVNFWAEWCGPCKAEMPDFEAVHQALGDQVRFVGIDLEDRPDAALAFAAEVGVTYDLLEDPDGAYFRAAQGRGTPQTLLVAADGSVRYRHAGPMTRATLEDLLAEHLGVAA